jgi:hypothetical protein
VRSVLYGIVVCIFSRNWNCYVHVFRIYCCNVLLLNYPHTQANKACGIFCFVCDSQTVWIFLCGLCIHFLSVQINSNLVNGYVI